MSAIPKKWINQQGLSKGDYVEFEQLENYLLVSAKPLPKDKSIKISLKKAERIGIIRLIQMLYDAGFKKIDFDFLDKDILNYIVEVSEWFEGSTLSNIKSSSCDLEFYDAEMDFANYFRKVFLNSLELPVLFSELLSGKNKIDEINATVKAVYRGSMVVKRKINTSQLPLEYKYYYFISIQLEEIADQYLFLLKYLKEMKRYPKILLQLNNKLRDLFKETYDNFYRFKLDWFIASERGLIWKWFETEEEPLTVYHLRAISERIKNIMKYTIGIAYK
jgi:hypothetical protein